MAKTFVYYFGVDWGTRAVGPLRFPRSLCREDAFEKPYGFTGQPQYFALWARRYMHEYGLTERDLATIAVTQRESALCNPLSQSTRPMTYDDYFASRMVSDPLRVPDCCLITDGACAFVDDKPRTRTRSRQAARPRARRRLR